MFNLRIELVEKQLGIVNHKEEDPTETMSHEAEEDLLEYSDNEQEVQVDNKATEVNAEGNGESQAKDSDKKGSYVGIHSTGFKDFLLKPELSRAIIDCGFEHPSEVQQHTIPQSIHGTDVLCQAKSGLGKTAAVSYTHLLQKVIGRWISYTLISSDNLTQII